MKIISLLQIPRQYANNGQHAEQVFRFTLTGRIERADNLSHTKGGDCGTIQVKSARATVCKGIDLDEYLSRDGATEWAYITEDFSKAYIMSLSEWKAFVEAFGTITTDSAKNGGHKKIRLRYETDTMREWLERA